MGREAGRTRQAQNGFTTVELLTGLLILALMAGASIPIVLGMLDTYHRNGAARQVLPEIRQTQSLAVTRGVTLAFQWGGSVSYPASQYRIVQDTSGACALPATGTAENGTTVVKGWTDVSKDYKGLTIQSIKDNNNVSVGTVMFNSRGASVNTCSAVSFPVIATVSDQRGLTRQIEIRSAGNLVLR